MPGIRSTFLAVLTSWAALAPPGGLVAQATDPDSLRQEYRLPVPTAQEAAGLVVRANPAFSPGPLPYPSGSHLIVFGGVAYTPETRYNDARHDGTALVGAAFGDPATWIGIGTDLVFYTTLRSGLFKRMGLSLEAYRFLPGGVLLTLGWENVATRGESDIGESQYGILTRWFWLRGAGRWLPSMGVSLGVGNGRFVSEDDWLAGNTDHLNVFGSVSLQLNRWMGTVADWQGDDLTLGLPFTPLQDGSLIITPAVYDVTGRVGSGTGFMISAVYLHHFSSPF